MNKYLASLCWLLITVFSMVQFASPALLDTPESTPHAVPMSNTMDMAQMDTHCASQNCADNPSQSHCANALCIASCAAHCMSVVPLAIVKTSVLVMHNSFESMSAFKPNSSAIQPSTPPPKSA